MEVSNDKIYLSIVKELEREGDEVFALNRNRLIGEEIISCGTRTAEIRRVIKNYWREFRESKTKKDWLQIVEKLLSTRVFDSQMAGIFLLGHVVKKFLVEISVIKRLISKYIDNWATCDAISSEIAIKFRNSPKSIGDIIEWAKSQNPFLRRVAVVILVKVKSKIKNWKKIVSQIFSLFEKEKEPIVKKALVWLKKETFSQSGV